MTKIGKRLENILLSKVQQLLSSILRLLLKEGASQWET